MKTKEKNINLLPKEYIAAETIRFYKKVGAAIVALEIIGFVAFVVLPPKQEVERTRIELENIQLQANDPKYAGVNKTLNDLEQAQADITTLQGAYTSIKQPNYIGEALLDELIGRVPNGVIVQQLNISDDQGEEATKTIEIKGLSVTLSAGLNYVNVLETLFPSYAISNEISYDETTQKYQYTVEISVDDEKQERIEGEETAEEQTNIGEEMAEENEEQIDEEDVWESGEEASIQ